MAFTRVKPFFRHLLLEQFDLQEQLPSLINANGAGKLSVRIGTNDESLFFHLIQRWWNLLN